jgi:hypothetical protein
MKFRFTIGIVVASVFALGLLFAAGIAKQREIQAQFELIAGLQERPNLSDPLDSLKVPLARFVIDVAGNGTKQVSTNFVWNGTTVRGRRVSIRLSGVAPSTVDLNTGKVETSLPFELTLASKRYSLPVFATTETITDAFGTISGQRAVITGKSARLKLVGSTKFTIDKKDLNPQGNETGPQIIVVRIIGEGVITAVKERQEINRNLKTVN